MRNTTFFFFGIYEKSISFQVLPSSQYPSPSRDITGYSLFNVQIPCETLENPHFDVQHQLGDLRDQRSKCSEPRGTLKKFGVWKREFLNRPRTGGRFLCLPLEGIPTYRRTNRYSAKESKSHSSWKLYRGGMTHEKTARHALRGREGGRNRRAMIYAVCHPTRKSIAWIMDIRVKNSFPT